MLNSFPIFLTLDQGCVILSGQGPALIAKLRLLLQTSAQIRLFTRDRNTQLNHLLGKFPNIAYLARSVTAQDITDSDVLMWIHATNDARDATSMRTLAKAHKILINIVDNPANSDFTIPAIVNRAPVAVAISTEGTAPSLAIDLRRKIAALMPENLGEFANFASGFRNLVHKSLPDSTRRRQFWRNVMEGSIKKLFLAGHEHQAEMQLATSLQIAKNQSSPREVTFLHDNHLRGKAASALMQADIVICDNMIAIGEYIRREADIIHLDDMDNTNTVGELDAQLRSGAKAVWILPPTQHDQTLTAIAAKLARTDIKINPQFIDQDLGEAPMLPPNYNPLPSHQQVAL